MLPCDYVGSLKVASVMLCTVLRIVYGSHLKVYEAKFACRLLPSLILDLVIMGNFDLHLGGHGSRLT